MLNPTPSSLLGMDGPEYTDIKELAWHLQLGLGIARSWPDAHSWATVSPVRHKGPHRTLTSDTVTLRP